MQFSSNHKTEHNEHGRKNARQWRAVILDLYFIGKSYVLKQDEEEMFRLSKFRVANKTADETI